MWYKRVQTEFNLMRIKKILFLEVGFQFHIGLILTHWAILGTAVSLRRNVHCIIGNFKFFFFAMLRRVAKKKKIEVSKNLL